MSEEENLDDFFAKKDKAKKPKKKKKTKTETVITQNSESQVPQVDEWADFEEQKEKDFSNLKIVDLQVGDEVRREEQEIQQNDEETFDGEDGEQNQTGIWKTSGQTPNEPPQKPVPVAEPVGTHNVVGGKYVPPSLKRATMAAASQPVVRRNRGAPPDIKSQAAFPTLSAATQDSSVPSDFEMVKRGTRTNEARRAENGAPRLDLGNRYDGLRS